MANETAAEAVVAAEAAKTDTKPEVDWENQYKAQTERLSQVEKERNDWRRGYDKYKAIAKSKLDDDSDDDETTSNEDLTRRIVREELLNSQVEQEKRKLEDMNQQMVRELREAKLALANRTQLGNSGKGASSEGAEVKDAFFSDEQLLDLKKRGLDPEKVKTNILKNKR